MIGIYNDAGERLAMTYRGLTINDDVYPVGIVAVGHQIDATTEPKPHTDGLESYVPRRLVTSIRIEGVVKADSVAQLHDRVDALNTAFDPLLAANEDRGDDVDWPVNPGYLPLAFSVPTEEIGTFPTGLMEMQYFVRSLSLPVQRTSKFEGDGARFSIELQCADPRRYLSETQEHEQTLFDGSEETLSNGKGTYPSWPIVTITMSGAGDASFGIDIHDDVYEDLRLDLSGLSNGDVIVIDMERRTIHKNGTLDMGLYESGEWFEIAPGDQPVAAIPSTGISSLVIAWTPARV